MAGVLKRVGNKLRARKATERIAKGVKRTRDKKSFQLEELREKERELDAQLFEVQKLLNQIDIRADLMQEAFGCMIRAAFLGSDYDKERLFEIIGNDNGDKLLQAFSGYVIGKNFMDVVEKTPIGTTARVVEDYVPGLVQDRRKLRKERHFLLGRIKWMQERADNPKQSVRKRGSAHERRVIQKKKKLMKLGSSTQYARGFRQYRYKRMKHLLDWLEKKYNLSWEDVFNDYYQSKSS